MTAFAPGSTTVRRDVWRGKVWTAHPYRALSDDGRCLLLACWPGIRMLAPTTWIDWLLTGDDAVRKQAIPNLVAGEWQLGDWTWRDRSLLCWYFGGSYFSIHRHFDPDGTAGAWYVNFERPYRRTPIGIDTFDLLLDLVIAPDLSSCAWKDEDEYAQARRFGLIDDATHARVEAAREQALSMLATHAGPFRGDWAEWQPDARWPVPALPPDALTTSAEP